MNPCQLFQVITFFRKYSVNLHVVKNCLDLFFTTNPSLVKVVSVLPGISDHDMVMVDLEINPITSRPTPRKIHKFKSADWHEIKAETAKFSESFLAACSKNSVEVNWSIFKKHMLLMTSKFVPSKTLSSRSNLPWFTARLRSLTRKKQKLYNQAMKSSRSHTDNYNTPEWHRYKEFKKLTENAIKHSHWEYVNNTLTNSLEDGNSKPFWRYIKSKKQDSSGIAPLKSKGKLFSESRDKANILNSQFESVFSNETPSALPKPPGKQLPHIADIDVTIPGVHKLLSQINVRKAVGPDAIPNLLLKTLCVEIAPVITSLFRQSLVSGDLPEDWRNAFISPIFKKGDKHLASNYRPVSLTCVISKLLEHIIVRHLMTHLESHNILTDLQHGFRRGFSCESQLLNTLDDLTKSYDKKQQVDVAILDFSKAFDVVSHRKLLHKLSHYGIKGSLHLWITHFLQDRKQSVVIDGHHSDQVSVASGVPHGTCLGPILFLIYINDITVNIKCQLRLFADDALIYTQVRSFSDHIKLQNDLITLENWANTWGMRFNPSKCYVLSITKKIDPPLHYFYKLCGVALEHKSENPYLGVNFSSNLTFRHHINVISAKANSTLGFLRRNLRRCPAKLKETSYKALVRSKLEYASPIWDPYLQKDKDKLEAVQRRGARFVTKRYERTVSVTELLASLHWKSLEERRKTARLSLLYKIRNGMVKGVPANDLVINTSKTRAGSTRNNYKLITGKTDIFRNSFFPRTIREWNQLPEATKAIVTLPAFQNTLDADI